jgi:hypothetical protein
MSWQLENEVVELKEEIERLIAVLRKAELYLCAPTPEYVKLAHQLVLDAYQGRPADSERQQCIDQAADEMGAITPKVGAPDETERLKLERSAFVAALERVRDEDGTERELRAIAREALRGSNG